METTDRYLLTTRGGSAAPAQVVLIPTASGLEPGMPERWNSQGTQHFMALGAAVTALPLITRDDAHDPTITAALATADYYYFSGGNPEYLIDTLRDTPSWEIMRARYQQGAVLAGCSAGAMMLGTATVRIRTIIEGKTPAWTSALNVVPGIVVMPHFDRIVTSFGLERFQQLLALVPPELTLLGIDEDTALIWDAQPTPGGRWHVMGRQTVSLFHAGQQTSFVAGETVQLPAPDWSR
jgi:cyanophycinase